MATKIKNVLRYCSYCNYEKDLGLFFTTENPHSNGYTVYCKDCCEKIYKEYFSVTNDIAKALFYTCAEIGKPFVLRIYKATMEARQKEIDKYKNEINPNTGKPKRTVVEVKKYIDNYKMVAKYLNMLRITNSEESDWHTFFSGTDVDYKDVSNNIKELEVKENEKQKFILDWGIQDDIEDYEFLEFQFDQLTDGIEFQNKAQELLYRDLCLARLTKRKIESGKDDNNTLKEVQTQILTLMKTLKIDNFEEKKEQTLVERMLESRIAIQEKEKPAFYYEGVKKEENKDYLGRGKYFYDHIYRPFHNVLKGSKLYKIVEEEKDETDVSGYEDIMENGKVKEVK